MKRLINKLFEWLGYKLLSKNEYDSMNEEISRTKTRFMRAINDNIKSGRYSFEIMEGRDCHKEFHKLYGHKCDVADLVEYLGLHPYVKDVIDLLIRFRDKNGKQDLEKIKHYVDLLIELEYGNA